MAISVFLDLDDTILDFHRAEDAAIRRTLHALHLPQSDAVAARYSAINAEQWRRLERGEITRDQVKTERFAMLFAELGVQRDTAKARDIYETFLSQGHYFIPGAPELLEALYGRYDLYLVSNGGGRVQSGRLDSAGIRRYFRGIFISEQMGVTKPSPAFFDACFAAIPDFDRVQAVIVGDSLTSDILGGLRSGLRTVWFNPEHKPPRPDIPADHEIHALAELPPLLASIFR